MMQWLMQAHTANVQLTTELQQQQQQMNFDFQHTFLALPGARQGENRVETGKYRDSHLRGLWLPEWSRGRGALPLDTS